MYIYLYCVCEVCGCVGVRACVRGIVCLHLDLLTLFEAWAGCTLTGFLYIFLVKEHICIHVLRVCVCV